MQVMTIQILKSVSFKGIEAGKISPNSDDYYTDADGTQKAVQG